MRMDEIYSQIGGKEQQVALCPVGLQGLLDVGQMVVHTGNFRHDIIFNARNKKRYEVIDEMRRVLFYVEQEDKSSTDKRSIFFKIYNSKKEEVAHILVPPKRVCVCAGLSWHCWSMCHLTAVVYSPLGVIVGFVRRKRTMLVQEFEILSPHEQLILRLRGALNDLQIHSGDMGVGVGRVSMRGWVGVMHEVRRTHLDQGITFPVDLDVRVKCLLLSAAIVIVHVFHK